MKVKGFSARARSKVDPKAVYDVKYNELIVWVEDCTQRMWGKYGLQLQEALSPLAWRSPLIPVNVTNLYGGNGVCYLTSLAAAVIREVGRNITAFLLKNDSDSVSANVHPTFDRRVTLLAPAVVAREKDAHILLPAVQALTWIRTVYEELVAWLDRKIEFECLNVHERCRRMAETHVKDRVYGEAVTRNLREINSALAEAAGGNVPLYKGWPVLIMKESVYKAVKIG